MLYKQCKFKLDVLKANGEFLGVAAAYHNVDLQNDRIAPSAFRKTLAETGARVPLLLDHRQPVGISNLEDWQKV